MLVEDAWSTNSLGTFLGFLCGELLGRCRGGFVIRNWFGLPLRVVTIDVSQIAVRVDDVADELFEILDFCAEGLDG